MNVKNVTQHAILALVHQQNAHHVMMDSFTMEMEDARNVNHLAKHAVYQQQIAHHVLMDFTLIQTVSHVFHALNIVHHVLDQMLFNVMDVKMDTLLLIIQNQAALNATKHVKNALV